MSGSDGLKRERHRHVGRRRRPPDYPVGRFIALGTALVAVAVLLALPGPTRAPAPVATAPIVVEPQRPGLAPVNLPARLADGTSYTPRASGRGLVVLGLAPWSRDHHIGPRAACGRGAGNVVESDEYALAAMPRIDDSPIVVPA